MLVIKSPLNEYIKYKYTAMNSLKNSQKLLSLLSNNPDIDLDSDEAYEIQDNNFYDYSFSDETFQTNRAVVFVESAMRIVNEQIKGMKIFVQIICNKSYTRLTSSLFKGIKGNRRDNIAKEVSDILEGSEEFGIGKLQLTECEPCSVPNGFTGITMTFDAVDFMRYND